LIDEIKSRESLLPKGIKGGDLRTLAPLDWVNPSLLALEERAPGLIAKFVASNQVRRNAVLLALSRSDPLGDYLMPLGDARALAVMLRDGAPKDILYFSLGVVPDGLVGALARLIGEPLASREALLVLQRIFLEPGHKRAGLQWMGEITESGLMALEALEPAIVCRAVVEGCVSPHLAFNLNRAVAFLRTVSSGLTDEVLQARFASIKAPSGVPRLLRRLLHRADVFPPQPVEADDEIRPLVHGRDFVRAARKYRNCLRDKLGPALSGALAIAEFRGEALLEFRPLTMAPGWMLREVHVHGNDVVPREILEAAKAKCAALQIPFIDQPHDRNWRMLQLMIREPAPFAWAA
jgi:hypothetical protein